MIFLSPYLLSQMVVATSIYYFLHTIPAFKNSYFKSKGNIENLNFNSSGLIPAIAQCSETKDVLMLAWMNKESIRLTIETKNVTYFSRSRNKLWVKGETSGNYQYLKNIKSDCDNDTILLTVKQIGPACHLGTKTCFDNE